ncbi:ECF-type sigma factor [Acidisarcina polymorpha]|uniref:ECF-type sigma factor n=1 Tax=Acidisarcina polymorpha TaxID=2211140 RepID=UPI00191BF4F0|nr:ECF-type sigma factor [Acidisarcina polymorpha]
MMAESTSQVTRLLHACRSGDSDALNQLLPLVYEQLHSLAANYMRRERGEHTLQATALVHEAYLRLFDETTDWVDRAHFLAIAAITMRRILVEHARSSRRIKRGSGAKRIELDDLLQIQPPMDLDVLSLDFALSRLTEQDARKGRLIELTYFGGMNAAETAIVLGVSTATVNRDLKLAKAWLRNEIGSAQARLES